MIKVKNLKLYLSFSKKLCDESTWDSGGIDPQFPNLGSRWMFKTRPLLLPGRKLPGSHSILNLFSSRDSLDSLRFALPENVTPIIRSPWYNLQKKIIWWLLSFIKTPRLTKHESHFIQQTNSPQFCQTTVDLTCLRHK